MSQLPETSAETNNIIHNIGIESTDKPQNLKAGDKCEIFSRSKQLWFPGEVIEEITSKRGKELTVRYKYETKYIKKRLSIKSKDLRTFKIEHHKDIVKCICGKPMQLINAQNYSQFLHKTIVEYKLNIDKNEKMDNDKEEKAQETAFDVGDIVQIIGLKNQTQYNGSEGIITGKMNQSKHRYPVQITFKKKETRILSLKPINLKKCEIDENSTLINPEAAWKCAMCGTKNKGDVLNCNACTYSKENSISTYMDIKAGAASQPSLNIITISCAACAYTFLVDDDLFHCSLGAIPVHNAGYSICSSCALNEDDEPIKNGINEEDKKNKEIDPDAIASQVGDVPFAEGSARFAYLGVWQSGPKKGTQCVIKRYKNACYNMDDIQPDIKCCELAAVLVDEWNSMNLIAKKYEIIVPIIARKGDVGWELILLALIAFEGFDILIEELLKEYESKQKDGISRGEVVTIEDYLKGNFLKWNSNSGWMHMGEADISVQAFCHWTYHFSKGEYLFCDAQGVKRSDKYILTDPCILSNTKKGKLYGITDMGRDYLLNWFRTHKCNKFCNRNWRKPSVTELDCVPQNIRRRMTKASSYNVSKIMRTQLNKSRSSICEAYVGLASINEQDVEHKSINKYDNPEWQKFDRYLSWQNGERIVMCSTVMRQKAFGDIKRVLLLSSFEKLYLIDASNKKRVEEEFTKTTIVKVVVISKWQMELHLNNNIMYLKCSYEAQKWKELIDRNMELYV